MSTPAFCDGIQYFGEALQGFEQYGKQGAIVPCKAVNATDAAAYQVVDVQDEAAIERL